MIQNTDNKPLSELYSTDHKITYHIPKYQREYIWSKSNWEALFDDVEESNGGHFLGSIICINTETDSHKPAKLELVDGQQRMTTISLFYLAIYKYLEENIPNKEDMEEQLDLMSLRNRIILNDNKSIRLFPSYSNCNLEDYEYIFSEVIAVLRITNKPKNFGNRRIAKAYQYFYDRLNSVDETRTPNFNYQKVKHLLNKLNSATLVKIDVATHSDAFILFETLNNRGVPLSAIDLIKNKLLGRLEKKENNTNLEENFNRWNNIIKNLTDNYNIQERFLRHFYNAFQVEENIKVNKVTKATKSNLISIYEELINKDVEYIFDRLEDASKIYSQNINYDNEENTPELIRTLRNLENVNGADAYMLLLFLTKKFSISTDEKIKVIQLLCNYFIRRNVTDTPPTRDLTNYFINIIDKLNENASYSYETLRNLVLEFGKPATDEYFKQKLNGNLYEENIGATRYILSSIELSENNTRERYVNFYDRNKNQFIWTIEHILPQGENIPLHWVNMIADGDREIAEDIRKEFVHKLGNLTLTGYNSQLSNASLDKKQNKKDKEGRNIGFNNGLFLNNTIQNISSWNKDQIIERTNTLVEKALNLFKI